MAIGNGANHHNLVDITSGSDGALWFTNVTDRITTHGTISTYNDSSIGGAVSITAGPDGAMWIADHLNEPIGRVSVP